MISTNLRQMARNSRQIFATPMRSLSSVSAPSTPGIYEFRTYDVDPSSLDEYLTLCNETRGVRKELNPGFLAFFVTETGGDVNRVTHLYRYENYDERDEVRRRMGGDARWRNFLSESKRLVRTQQSEIFLEASAATKAAGLGVNDMVRRALEEEGKGKPGIFEMRRYQLELGYNPIPKLVDLMSQGLPSKMASDAEKKSSLVWMGFSDVGKLNQFVELWRYDTFQDHIRVREAARTAKEWRACINEIAPMVQMFDTQLMKPVGLSPIQ